MTVRGLIGFKECEVRDTIQVIVHDLPNIKASPDSLLCKGDSIELHVSGGLRYLWDASPDLSCLDCPDPVAFPSATTTYYVTAWNEHGCKARDSLILTVKEFSELDAGDDITICFGEEIQLQARGAERYLWDTSPDLNCLDCPDPIATPSTTTTYYVTAWNNQGCKARDSVLVVVEDLSDLDAGDDIIICSGEKIQLLATGAERFLWDDTPELSCLDCPNPTLQPKQTQMYYLTGWSTNGCIARDSVKVMVYEPPVAEAGNDTTICLGDSIQLHGSGEGDYLWLPARDISCLNCSDPIVYPKSTRTYLLRVENQQGCIAWDSVTIRVQESGDLLTRGDTAFCIGGSAQLATSGAESYRWSPSKGLSCNDCPNPTATPEATTTYYVVGTNGFGECSSLDSVTVVVHPLPVIDAGLDRAICSGESIQLLATGGLRYRWEASPDLSCIDCPDPVVSPKRTTTYVLRGFNAEGCDARDSVTVVVHPSFAISAGEDQSICLSERAMLKVTGGIRWQWSPNEGLSCDDCPNPEAFPEKTTTYRVQGWNAEGCEATDSVTVVVREEPEVVRLRISREHRGHSGERLIIPVTLIDEITASDINELSFVLRYDPEIMMLDVNAIEGSLAGTVLEGWHIEILNHKRGKISLQLHAPTGERLSGSGELLRFTSRLYLSEVFGTELLFEVSSPSECFAFIEEPGYAELDSICGLNFRLIEASTQKYLRPVAYPNPASERVRFEFGLGLDGITQLEVYDAGGNRIGLIVDDLLEAGRYSVEWDVSHIPSGVYWYRLSSGDWRRTAQMIVRP